MYFSHLVVNLLREGVVGFAAAINGYLIRVLDHLHAIGWSGQFR